MNIKGIHIWRIDQTQEVIMNENQDIELKSLKILQTDLTNEVNTFVAFANARGGKVLIGIENNCSAPPQEQRIKQAEIDKVHKRINELTYNVGVSAQKVISENGGEYIEVRVYPSESSIAATKDGRYYIRIGDQCHPVMPDDMERLFSDKGSFIWELKTRGVNKDGRSSEKTKRFIELIKASDRVSDFIKAKSDSEILEYYNLIDKKNMLTNLGVLWIGTREDRTRLTYAPSIQFIKYDEREIKVKKQVWNDYSLNPLELIEAIWSQIADWKEMYEIPDGIFRQSIPQYDEAIIRELLVNALIHRPYTIRGDIYITLYHDRLEITNPGRLPIGVTPQNILHAKQHRNRLLCQICYALKLMEQEGSGFDMIYEKLTMTGRPIPQVIEGIDSVTVRIYKRIIDNRIIDLLALADQRFELTQREKIALGLIAQQEAVPVVELSKLLELTNNDDISNWIGKLKSRGIVISKAKTKGTLYLLNPDFIKSIGFKGRTSLVAIEKHRLKELIITDLERYGLSSISDIHKRIGEEIPVRMLRRELKLLVEKGLVRTTGEKKWRKYIMTKNREINP